MSSAMFLAASRETSGIPLPVMTVIAMLLLMLPYLIRRYTGRSVTEWLRFSTIIESLEKAAARIRGALFGKGLNGALFSRDAAGTKAGAKGKNGAGSRQPTTAEKNEAENERTRIRQRAGNVQNDYLHTVSEILTFARKNRLFAIIPGNIAFGGQTAALTAILVTRSRAVGILAYGFDGKILCRRDEQEWQVQDDGRIRQIGKLNAEAAAQDGIVRGALAGHGMEEIPYETAMVFTSSMAVLAGERPQRAYAGGEFFESLRGDADLRTGTLDPKETGKRISALRAGKKK